MKNKMIKSLILILSFFFFLGIDVWAISQSECYYQSIDGEEIKLLIDANGNGTLFKSNDYSVGYGFIPINRIFYQEAEVRFAHLTGGYIPNNFGNYLSGCPESITTYYTETGPFNSYVYYEDIYEVNQNFDGMPIIELSETAYKDGDEKGNPSLKFHIDNPDVNPLEYDVKDYCFNNNFNSFCKENIGPNIEVGTTFLNKEYNLLFDKTYSEKPVIPDDQYLECFYYNSEGYKLKMHFYSNNQHRHWLTNTDTWPGGEGELTSIHDNYGNFSTCPSNVYFLWGYDSAYNRQLFQIPATCPADEGACFYREDIKLEYDDNASKVINYYNTQNSKEVIKIKILKIPDINGDDIKTTLYVKEIDKGDIHINDILNFADKLEIGTTDTYPGYIYEKNGVYTISEKEPNAYKKENNEGYDKVYMLSLNMLEIQGLGNPIIIQTCESLFDRGFVDLIKTNFFRLIYIGVPILLLVLTTFDFAQVVFVDDKEGIQKAFNKFKKRAIVAVLIYFVPTILTTIIDIVGVDNVGKCIKTFTELK